ncbi:RNA polymerase sigma factor FliA [soil metagenome]
MYFGMLPPFVQSRIPSAEELRQFLPMVHDIVMGMIGRLPPNVLRDDLVAAGTCGLLKALSRDTTERAGPFEAYARVRIHGAIVDELRTQDWLSRSARRAETEHPERRFFIPLEELPEHGQDIAGPSDDLDLALDLRVRIAEILDAIDDLPSRQRRLVRMVYVEGMLLKDVAVELRLSLARVSQLHVRAMMTLRANLVAA